MRAATGSRWSHRAQAALGGAARGTPLFHARDQNDDDRRQRRRRSVNKNWRTAKITVPRWSGVSNPRRVAGMCRLPRRGALAPHERDCSRRRPRGAAHAAQASCERSSVAETHDALLDFLRAHPRYCAMRAAAPGGPPRAACTSARTSSCVVRDDDRHRVVTSCLCTG